MIRYLIALFLCLPVSALDTGWQLPTGWASVSDGWGAWTSVSSIAADDGANAVNTPASRDGTDFLKATFTLTIPSGATINGVEVKYEISTSATLHNEYTVKLVVGGSIVGANRSIGTAIATTPTVLTRGGAADLWSTTITQAQATATDFGFIVQTMDNDSGDEQARVDYMSIKIYYTEAGGSPAPDPGFLTNFLETE